MSTIFEDLITFAILGVFAIVAIAGFMKKSPRELLSDLKEMLKGDKEEE